MPGILLDDPPAKPIAHSWSKAFSAGQQTRLTEALMRLPESQREIILKETMRRLKKKVQEAENAKRHAIKSKPPESHNADLPRTPLWKYGGEPVPFDVFCEQCLELRLFPKQRQVFDESGIIRARDLLDPQRLVQTLTIIFGKGCIAGETKLRDETTGVTRTAAQWAKRGVSLTVRTLLPDLSLGLAVTSPVYHKGKALLYRFELNNGRKVSVTGEHRFYTLLSRSREMGWRKASALRPGNAILAHAKGDKSFVGIVSITPERVDDFYDLTVPGTENYFDAGGICHHNSGKGIMIAAFVAYHGFVVLNLANPFQVYGAHKDTELSIINVAPSAEVAEQVFFTYLQKHIAKPIFKPFLPDPRHQILKHSIEFPQASLVMYSKHSNPKTLDGNSPISFIIDEGDDFYDANGSSTADKCFKILMRSSKTRYLSLALGILISYPRTEDGFMMRMFRLAESDPSYYRMLASTFDVRPDRSIDDPSIASDYKNDPRGSRAAYECVPMPALDAFFEFPDRIMSCVDDSRLPCASVALTEPRKEETRTGEVIEYVTFAVNSILRKPGATYFMGIDAGEKGDSYAIAVMHIEEAQDAAKYLCTEHANNLTLRAAANYVAYEGGCEVADAQGKMYPLRCSICLADARGRGTNGWMVRDANFDDHAPIILNGREWGIPHVFEDLVIEIRPETAVRHGEKDRTVDFLAVAAAVENLTRALDIRVVGMDKWQTTQMRQGLVSATGADVREMSFTNADQYKRARLTKMLVYQQRLTLLGSKEDYDGKYEKRNTEWRQIQLINGVKIQHPETGSKDIWDAETVAIYLAVQHKCADIDIGLM